MTEHPSIAAMMNHGYQYPDPPVVYTCKECTGAIHQAEKVIEYNASHYCGEACLLDWMTENDHITFKVAGE